MYSQGEVEAFMLAETKAQSVKKAINSSALVVPYQKHCVVLDWNEAHARYGVPALQASGLSFVAGSSVSRMYVRRPGPLDSGCGLYGSR